MKLFFYKKISGLLVAFCCITVCRVAGQTMHTLQFRSVQDTKDYFHYTGDHFLIISGHRGGATAGFPENSLATFEHTLDQTPAMFEIDPHLTKDSGIVLLHDAVLDRVTTGHGKLNSFTLDQVRKFYLKDPAGNQTPYHLNTLAEAIQWSRGKTIVNLDVKDVPLVMKANLVKKYHAFAHVMFTVHNAGEARFFYDFDHRSLFSAWILTEKAYREYQAARIPWSNFLIAYIGPDINQKNKALIKTLHQQGVMVMVGAGPSDDTLPDPVTRAEAYRQILRDGADIIESDRPTEVAEAVKSLYPAKSEKYKYWGKKK